MAESHLHARGLSWGLAILAFALPLIITPDITLDHFLLPKHCLFMAGVAIWLAAASFGGTALAVQCIRNPPFLIPGVVVILCGLINISRLDVNVSLILGLFLLLTSAIFLRETSPIDRERPFEFAVLAGFIVAVYTIFQDYGLDFYNYEGAVPDWRGKLLATLGNPNHVGDYLALVLPYAIIRYATASRAPEAAGWAVVSGVIIAALTVVFTVGVWLGVFAVIILSPFLVRFLGIRFPFPRRLLLIPCLFALVFAYYLTDNPLNPRGESLFRQAESSMRWKTGAGARQWIWGVTARMLREHPLRGVGDYIRVYQVYAGKAYLDRSDVPHDRDYVARVDHAHSEIYEFYAVCGAVGGCALLWLILAYAKIIPRSFHRCPLDERPILFACLCALIISFVHVFAGFQWHIAPSAFLTLLYAGRILSWSHAEEKPGEQRSWSFNWVIWVIAVIAVFLAWTQFEGSRQAKLGQGATFAGEAERHFRRSIRFNPSADNLAVYAEWLLRQRQYEAAIPVLETWDTVEASMNARLWLVQANQALGRRVTAADWMRKVLEVNPAWPGYLEELAEITADRDESSWALERAAVLWARLQRLWINRMENAGNPLEAQENEQKARDAAFKAASILERLITQASDSRQEELRAAAKQIRIAPLDPSTASRLNAMFPDSDKPRSLGLGR